MSREGFLVYHELLSWLEPYGDAERGRILTAMLVYSLTGEAPRLSGNERYIWSAIKEKIDRDKEKYEDRCETNRNNRQRSSTIVNDRQRNAPTETKTKTEIAHSHGTYGWVKLTDRQYQRLVEDLGQEETDRCIQYVDESAQSTNNRNGWKDWNLTVRKCSRNKWGAGQGGGQTADPLADSYKMMEQWANEER